MFVVLDEGGSVVRELECVGKLENGTTENSVLIVSLDKEAAEGIDMVDVDTMPRVVGWIKDALCLGTPAELSWDNGLTVRDGEGRGWQYDGEQRRIPIDEDDIDQIRDNTVSILNSMLTQRGGKALSLAAGSTVIFVAN